MVFARSLNGKKDECRPDVKDVVVHAEVQHGEKAENRRRPISYR